MLFLKSIFYLLSKMCFILCGVSNLYAMQTSNHFVIFIYCDFLGEKQRLAFRLMLSACVRIPRIWTSRKRFEIETLFLFKLRGITPDIICKSLTRIGLQIPRCRNKICCHRDLDFSLNCAYWQRTSGVEVSHKSNYMFQDGEQNDGRETLYLALTQL